MEKNTNSKWHYAFSVDNIETFIQKLEKANIPYGGIDDPSKKIVFRPDGIKQVYIKDPNGYWIEVNNDSYWGIEPGRAAKKEGEKENIEQ